MKIKWFGYSSFLITSEKGFKIITDPYQPDEKAASLAPIIESANVVTMSHGHFAVSYVYTITGEPRIYKGQKPVKINGVKFHGVKTMHGDNHGANFIICFEVDGIMVCHLGDLGHRLSQRQLGQVGKVDILIVPADGTEMTLLHDTALQVITQLCPRVVIPMRHFVLKEFTRGLQHVVSSGTSEVEFTGETLPHVTQVVVLKPALAIKPNGSSS